MLAQQKTMVKLIDLITQLQTAAARQLAALQGSRNWHSSAGNSSTPLSPTAAAREQHEACQRRVALERCALRAIMRYMHSIHHLLAQHAAVIDAKQHPQLAYVPSIYHLCHVVPLRTATPRLHACINVSMQ
jgi:hypothetical protein